MREVTVKLYNFSELGKEAQAKAIKDWRNKGYAFGDSDAVTLTDKFKEELESYGFDDDVKIEWSLGYCQGDGVAFYGSIDLEKILPNHLGDFTKDEQRRLYWLNNEYGISIKTVRNSYGYRYSHAYTMDIDLYCDYPTDYRETELYDEVLQKLEDIVLNDIQSLSLKLEREGYKFIERMESDEVIREFFEYNDDCYEFTGDGTLYR
jgi:hypothetical protein